jgi:dTDP-glucose pyrophosphorylase
MNILIPMAGLATRFAAEGIKTIKPLIVVNGKTLIEHTLETLNLDGNYIFITRRYDNPEDNVALSAMLRKLKPGSTEICLDHPTRGAVETCLAAAHLIDNDIPLVQTNCDQRTEWNSKAFIEHISNEDVDGTLVTHESIDPKHSYARVEHGMVTETREKQVVSNQALIGIHYWKHGRDFVRSAHELIDGMGATGKKECYVSESYNHLIGGGKIITAFQVGKNEYIPLGTPYDVALYEAKVREYQTEKPKSLFIDLDGTLLQHAHRFSEIEKAPTIPLDGAIEKINQWDSIGHRIILCTARKESAREMTERQLHSLGLCWDHLLMGLTSGERVLVNDKLTEGAKDRAVAVNLITNKGLSSFNWKTIGL